MRIPLQITFRDFPGSQAIEDNIKKHVLKLEEISDDIISCRVTVSSPHEHKHKGKIYEVHVDLRLPGAELFVGNEPGKQHAHEDLYVAIRDAFQATKRQLKHLQRKRGMHRDRKVMPRVQTEDLGII